MKVQAPLLGIWRQKRVEPPRAYPWTVPKIVLPAVGLRETVLRVAFMFRGDVQATATAGCGDGSRRQSPLFYQVCDWRLHSPSHWTTLLAAMEIVIPERSA